MLTKYALEQRCKLNALVVQDAREKAKLELDFQKLETSKVNLDFA